MTTRTYPYDGWVLLPSFRPVKVTFEKPYGSWSNDDYGDISEAGKFYMRSVIYASRNDAITAGHNQLNLQQQRLDKQLATMKKRRAALVKAEAP
jgi:hypothetical protein